MAYPRVAAPAWLDALMAGVRPAETAARHVVDLAVKRAAAAFLGVPGFPADRIVLASSAGLALDRALAAVLAPGAAALTTSPSIDIVPAMLAERGVTVRYVAAAPPAFALDSARLAAALREQRPQALVLASPENPTGAYLGEGQLQELAGAARSAGAALVLDQCAAVLRRGGGRAPLLAALDPPDLDWVMIWDTGKTFGLGGEKLAFLFASPSLVARVRERVSLVEFEAPLRVRMLVAELLGDPRSREYVRELVALVERNRDRLLELCAASGLTAVPTEASTLQLVLGEPGCADLVRARGVAVASGDCFFHAADGRESPADGCFRVALAREADRFDALLAAIGDALPS